MSVFIIAELNHVRVCTCMKICMNYNHTGAFFFVLDLFLALNSMVAALPLLLDSVAQRNPFHGP